MKEIQKYQRNVFEQYLTTVGLTESYSFPEGNQIRPLPPVHTCTESLMIIGAYPSAKFERIKGQSGRFRNIPIANNLHPFADETYFDGTQVRHLVSGRTIREYFLDPIGINIDDCWVTDLVKVFLYKPTHKGAIHDVFPDFDPNVLRNHFNRLAKDSMDYIYQEIELAQPKCIVTLGLEVAQAIEDTTVIADNLLTTEVKSCRGFKMINCPHPDACRQMEKWRDVLSVQIPIIKQLIEE